MTFYPTCAAKGMDTDLGRLAEGIALENGVPPALLKAVVAKESCWNEGVDVHPDGVSIGLAGVTSTTADVFWPDGRRPDYTTKAEELFDPARNLTVAARVLADLLRRHGGVVDAAVSGYNLGTFLPTDRLLNEERTGWRNQSYVDDVLAYVKFYTEREGEAAGLPGAGKGAGLLAVLLLVALAGKGA